MINKYHLALLLLLIVSTVSISIKPKNAEPAPATVNKQDADTGSKQQGGLANDKNDEVTEKPKETVKKKAQKVKEESKEKDSSEQPSKQTNLSQEKSEQTAKSSKNNKKSATQKPKLSTNQKTLSNNKASRKKMTHQEAVLLDKNDSKSRKLQEQPSFWGKFLLYGLMIGALCYGSKYVFFPKQSLVETVIDLLIIASSLFKPKKQGYEPPKFTEQIDDENTIQVGYNEEHGRQLFWQRNSVQGI